MLQVATKCAATLKAVNVKEDRLTSVLGIAKHHREMADAKCAALGTEIAKLYRRHSVLQRQDFIGHFRQGSLS